MTINATSAPTLAPPLADQENNAAPAIIRVENNAEQNATCCSSLQVAINATRAGCHHYFTACWQGILSCFRTNEIQEPSGNTNQAFELEQGTEATGLTPELEQTLRQELAHIRELDLDNEAQVEWPVTDLDDSQSTTPSTLAPTSASVVPVVSITKF